MIISKKGLFLEGGWRNLIGIWKMEEERIKIQIDKRVNMQGNRHRY
jgi:hypothetical protein